jgi:DNA-binding HxlR family transcriptional regulator
MSDDEDCALRRILELFSTNWTSMVLHVFHARLGGSTHAGVLLRAVPGVSKRC